MQVRGEGKTESTHKQKRPTQTLAGSEEESYLDGGAKKRKTLIRKRRDNGILSYKSLINKEKKSF